MTITYTCVANKSDIIVEVCTADISQREQQDLTYSVTQVLDRLQDEKDQKFIVYTLNSQSFFCLIENQNVFLMIANSQFEKVQAHQYLKNIAQLYNDQINSLTPKQLREQIRSMMAECTLKNQLEPNITQAKTKLTECVELLLVRSEKLQNLCSQVDDLQKISLDFNRHSTDVKETFWKRNKKYIIYGSICSVAIIVLIIILICIL